MKLSKEQINAIQYSCLDESTKTSENIIEYLDNIFKQQDKDIRIDRCLSIIAIIVSVLYMLF